LKRRKRKNGVPPKLDWPFKIGVSFSSGEYKGETQLCPSAGQKRGAEKKTNARSERGGLPAVRFAEP